MKKLLTCLVVVMLFFSYADRSHAVLGIPDHVPAPTLIVPFFEAGIDSVAYPQDTLPVITNVCTGPLTIHYEIYSTGGKVTALADQNATWGNFTIAATETKTFSVRALVSSALASTRALLTEGPFYRGFMTFDVVTADTSKSPDVTGYPFGSDNCLMGQIYYTRLTQGSSNGLAMVPVEATPAGTSSLLHGFYQLTDDRESMNCDGRYNAELMTRGLPQAINPTDQIQRIQSRLYLEPVNGATSRVIVFAYRTSRECEDCGPGNVTYARRNGAGTIVESGTVNLNRYVNIIDFSGSGSGWLNLVNIPALQWQIYAFSMNAASPPGAPELTWDAIFESFILP